MQLLQIELEVVCLLIQITTLLTKKILIYYPNDVCSTTELQLYSKWRTTVLNYYLNDVELYWITQMTHNGTELLPKWRTTVLNYYINDVKLYWITQMTYNGAEFRLYWPKNPNYHLMKYKNADFQHDCSNYYRTDVANLWVTTLLTYSKITVLLKYHSTELPIYWANTLSSYFYTEICVD